MTASSFCWICPACQAPLLTVHPALMQCSRCNCAYPKVQGVWRLLTAGQARAHEPFVANYDRVRHSEQWGASSGDYYRALPYRDLSGRHGAIWRIRAASFDTFVESVVQPLARGLGRPLRILDAGAGNGWLSYRLALQGHALLATDLRTDAADGLGACSWYMKEVEFCAAQSAFDELPLENDQMDVIVFNGSLHYAASYEATLGEALRVLREDGRLVILDTPYYGRARSGEQMVDELYGRLCRDYKIDPRVAKHENYLTPYRLDELASRLSLSWHKIQPFYGWRWLLAPWLARLRGRRQPARFFVFVGQRQS